MGTVIMFGLLSNQPEYNQKVNSFIALAPIIEMTNSTIGGAAIFNPFFYLTGLVNLNCKFLPSSPSRQLCIGSILRKPFQLFYLCLCEFLFGFNSKQRDYAMLEARSSRPIGDASLKSLRHFGQLKRRGPLAKYDYGETKNVQMYGQKEAPRYNLKAISCENICLVYAKNDVVTNEQDVLAIQGHLAGVRLRDVYCVPEESFSHTNFTFGKDTGSLVNEHVITLIGSF